MPEAMNTNTAHEPGIGGPAPVLSLTESALAKVAQFYEKMSEAKGKFFRVFVEGGGCSGFQYGFNFDEERPGDELVECGALKVLVDLNTKPYIMGATVDFVEDFKGSGFTVKNPNSKGSCGCGTSFTV